ncbi:hypothetical protein Aph01nite_65550 [Acrocarpospora phusangensis]|uniref:Lipoprotein n=1 Tax=Acrocarpospora phusangensis TaxID=1070424 RepID=A0A919QIW5_9ACTN|nr:hypothetical protein [Acrocarpospora phusangensis]GIH28245.1 hypothetical protein Aph01nite_65550 [Acrocarpospora phusangensis]
MKRIIAMLGAGMGVTAGCGVYPVGSEDAGPGGLRLTAVQEHLTEHWGIRFVEERGPAGITQHGSVHQEAGGRLSAVLGGRRPGRVHTISCQAYGSAPAAATGFLRDCAGIPFRGRADDALPKAGWPRYRRATVNGIRYRLSSVPEHSLWVLRLSLPDHSPLP